MHVKHLDQFLVYERYAINLTFIIIIIIVNSFSHWRILSNLVFVTVSLNAFFFFNF